MKTFEKALLWTIKIALWIIPVLPFYVTPSLLFPFITGKNFAFRILVELAFAAWIGLVAAWPQYRPKPTLLFKAITVFVGIVFLADIFSPNPLRSLFSNYERMEGFMMIGHLYLYYLMLSTIFKTKRDWIVFFHVSLGASLAVSSVGALQKYCQNIAEHLASCKQWASALQSINVPLTSTQGGFRIDATIGNPTYFAAYLLFHLWIALLLVREYWKKTWRAALYGAVFLFELFITYLTATRGVTLALVAVVPFLFLVVVLNMRRALPRASAAVRKSIIGVLIFVVVVPLFLWAMRGTGVVQGSPVLRRLTDFSLTQGTIQDRFLIWGMSMRGALERPFLGWGQENYYLVFQKYYNPGLYSAEPWFDRSHNIIFDWLVHAGILGLAAYLGIFVVIFLGIIKGMRRGSMPFLLGLILLGMFITYFLQNLFVFDNLNTYLLFFAFLAYTGMNMPGGTREDAHAGGKSGRSASPAVTMGVTFAALIIFLPWMYFAHVKPIREGYALINALQVNAAKNTSSNILIGVFQSALAYRTFGDTEVREQLANMARDIPGDNRYTPDDQKKIADFAVDELKKQTAGDAKDIKHLLFLGSLIDHLLAVTLQKDAPLQKIIGNNEQRQYAQMAEDTLREAIRLGPNKQFTYVELSQLYAITGNGDRAVETLKKGWDFDRRFKAIAENLIVLAVLTGKKDIVAEIQKEYPLETLNETALARLGLAYRQISDFPNAVLVYAALVKSSPNDAKIRAIYAGLLAQTGHIEEARAEAIETGRLDPSLKDQVDHFLQVLP
ncbi:MAG: O-antigen ligase family protein [Candidatus Sungbacteria bacterium]|nr:O-antigen ligase family protein [Candidatus Sungbacteria bacterium]